MGTVTFSVGDGSGTPGSTDNPVEISLENLDDRATGVQFDICRDTNLTLSACDNTGRTPTIFCNSFPLNDENVTDCPGGIADRILFFSFGGDFIDVGTGHIMTLRYDISPGVPVGDCQDLTLEGIILTSCNDNGAGGCTTGAPFDNVTLEEGEFCFLCADNADCDDGVDCTVDSCDQDGNCQYLPNDSLCDNGDFCDGAETCDAIAGCQPGTDPCPDPLMCDEDNDRCTNCLTGADCDDGVDCTVDSCDQDGNCQNTSDDAFCDDAIFCNGAETCDSIAGCQPGTDPCTPLLCDEENECYCDADGSVMMECIAMEKRPVILEVESASRVMTPVRVKTVAKKGVVILRQLLRLPHHHRRRHRDVPPMHSVMTGSFAMVRKPV